MQVGEHHRVAPGAEQLERLVPVVGGVGAEADRVELVQEHRPVDRVVLGDEDEAPLAIGLARGSACGRLAGASPVRASAPGTTAAGSPTGSGTMSRIVVPVPGALSIVTSPPISTASRWQITRPRPVPPKRCVVDGVGLRELLEEAPLLLLGSGRCRCR